MEMHAVWRKHGLTHAEDLAQVKGLMESCKRARTAQHIISAGKVSDDTESKNTQRVGAPNQESRCARTSSSGHSQLHCSARSGAGCGALGHLFIFHFRNS